MDLNTRFFLIKASQAKKFFHINSREVNLEFVLNASQNVFAPSSPKVASSHFFTPAMNHKWLLSAINNSQFSPKEDKEVFIVNASINAFTVSMSMRPSSPFKRSFVNVVFVCNSSQSILDSATALIPMSVHQLLVKIFILNAKYYCYKP